MLLHSAIMNMGRQNIPSAKEQSLPLWLILAIFILAALIITGLINNPVKLINTSTVTFGTLCTVYAVLRLAAVISPKPDETSLSPASLPVFTILLPVYREAHMIGTLAANIEAIDYPQSKMDIMIVCEPDDTATIEAARKLRNKNFRVFVTSGTGPRTKPNAMNAAMTAARGDIITVYDAEDRPHPNQLRAAAHAMTTNPRLAVVQAPLTYYNAEQNWLTRQFTLEYAALFNVWIPFLAKINLPFPLGGTSNHIRRTALEAVGGWDAYNVTEDADLSFRFIAHGWGLGYITPPTHEEAVWNFKAWRGQRSRWMKGYIQTWVTHMKRPLMPGGIKGAIRFLTLQLTVGVTLIAGIFHVPAFFCVSALTAYHIINGSTALPHRIFLITLAISYAAGIIIGMVGAVRAQQPKLILAAFGMPIYWLLLWTPSLTALKELRLKPFHWNKTEHGDRERTLSEETSALESNAA